MCTYLKLLHTNGKLAPKFGVWAPKLRVGALSLGCAEAFKASALWADAFHKSDMSVCLSVYPSVRLSICLCVCSLLRYRLTVFFPPLPVICNLYLG